ncbi:Ppx/GppA phosphatase family protein [Moheibacter lacus]|uniref:Exopolyphosphatase n=1 Tax=Moheibacter lacus TaxID=2745851 RepID=A0A838ZTC8_9FLAO|nr:exopolyphosphatase [Moheibacter lacus]MBA5630237.1 exopolyphosphatase [Moheibacter lacus]
MNIRKLAAIDIGSNAMRLLINYVYEMPGADPVFNKTSIVRMPIRLGEDVFIEKKISEKNIDRMVNAMQAYQLMMDIYGIENYLAYATSAMREATNGKEIVKKIKRKTGIDIEIIDGSVEAELTFATELKNFVLDGNNYLYVDVGGGSTELTVLTDGRVANSKSFPVGTVRLLEGKVEKSVYAEMKKWVEENAKHLNVSLIGSGGNINHVYKYSGVKLGKPLRGAYLRSRYKVIREMSYDDRLKELNMKPDRADVVEFALEIYTKVMKWSRAKLIHVPKIGISDGMIHSLYEKVK